MRHGVRRMKQGKNTGFTIVELMVALTAGAIVVTSMFAISSSSQKHFNEQQRVSSVQTNLRLGGETLRRDIARAGFLGTPSSRTDQRCVTPANEIQAIEITDGTSTGAIPLAAEHGVQGDTITLTGNYATSDAYLAIGLSGTGDVVYLQRGWQGFRRSFHSPIAPAYAFSAAAFNDAFVAGRMLHITTLNGNHFYSTIASADATAATITIGTPLPVGGTCVVGLADGAQIAPLSRVRYRVDGVGAGALAPRSAAVAAVSGATNSVLVREELTFAGAVVAGSRRIVMEHVVDFNIDAIVDTTTTATGAVNLARLTGAGLAPYAASGALASQRIRSLLVRVSARTPDQDPTFPWVARGAGAPLTRYRASAATPGASRVRTLEMEIFLPNLAYAGRR